jgi:hypothetical protein
MILLSGNRARPSGDAADSRTLTARPGMSSRQKVFRPVAFSTLGPSGGNMLVFAGRDMFIHAGSNLYCVRE